MIVDWRKADRHFRSRTSVAGRPAVGHGWWWWCGGEQCSAVAGWRRVVGGSRFPAAAVEGVGRVCRVASRVVVGGREGGGND